MSEKEKFYTLAQAEKIAGVSRATLTNACREGRLAGSQISDSSYRGFHWMVSEDALMDWVMDRKSIKAQVLQKNKAPSEMTVDGIAEWITNQIQKAYEQGFKDGVKQAKAQMSEAVKGLK